jgi:GDP-mannose 6-dehydrogenase
VKAGVFGLGYVGTVSAAFFARAGHTVVGVDANEQKVAMVNAGRSFVLEPGVEQLLGQTVAAG